MGQLRKWEKQYLKEQEFEKALSKQYKNWNELTYDEQEAIRFRIEMSGNKEQFIKATLKKEDYEKIKYLFNF